MRVCSRNPLFRVREKSGCMQRQCCGPMREFWLETHMRLRSETAASETFKGPLVSSAFRPFKCCTLACLNRPEMFVQSAERRQIGYVRQPFTCLSRDLTVDGPTESRPELGPPDAKARKTTGSAWPFRISAGCCQPGMCCRCGAGSCLTVSFEILDSADMPVGQVKKVFAGCCKELYQVSTFAVRFPAQATWYQKVCLLNAVIMMDFLWFEERPHAAGN